LEYPNMDLPVSVITAVRNGMPHIDASIWSIREQTFTNWELIVVDDCSTDATRALVDSHVARDSRIRLLSLPSSRGSGVARNIALRQSRGEFIAVQDADDIALPHRLESHLAVHREWPDACVSGGQLAHFGDWGGPRPLSPLPTQSGEIASWLGTGRMPLAHPALMFRAEAARIVGGYDEVCLRAQDLALMLRLRHLPMAGIPDVLTLYRWELPRLAKALTNGRFRSLAIERNLHGSDAVGLKRFAAMKSDGRSMAAWASKRISMVCPGEVAPGLNEFLVDFKGRHPGPNVR
jgi:glycosyltransferase involved in cell wall biosynthesis